MKIRCQICNSDLFNVSLVEEIDELLRLVVYKYVLQCSVGCQEVVIVEFAGPAVMRKG